ncbi:hypothetical protein V6N13_001274 [Hibiscus sabdariffa]
MVDTKGDWKWELIQNRLPDHILLQLAAIQRPKPSFPVDSIGWKLRNDGEFSAKTTYQHSSKGGPYIIVSHLHQLCNKDWRIVFSKFARCNNGVADWLAKFASDSNFDVVSFEAPPDGLELG